MTNIRAEIISMASALMVWEKSPEAGCFAHPNFLNYVCHDVQWWGGMKGDELVCAWPIPLDKRGKPADLSSFCYYVGPIWSSLLTQLPSYRWYATSQKIYMEMLKEILSHHQGIRFSFPVGAPDLRSFAWWNYGKNDLPKFVIEPRYTALIKDIQGKSDNDVIMLFRSDDRRKSIRKLLKTPPVVQRVTLDRPMTVISLYEETMRRTGGKYRIDDLEFLLKITEYACDGHGEVLCFAEEQSANIVAAQVMLDSRGITNAVAQGIRSDWQGKDLSLWLNYHSIISARDRGSNIFDFNGANSPNRADDKHAYGADYALYFDLSYLA